MRSELEIVGKYKWDYKHFRVSLELTSQNASLNISVMNKNNFDRFFVIIDQKYISLKQDFKNLFENPIELNEYLTNSINQIAIEGDGELFRFQYEFARSKKKSKFFVIKLEKSQLIPIQQANSRLNHLQTESQTLVLNNKLLQQKLMETINQHNAQITHLTAVNERISNNLKVVTDKNRVEKKRNFELEVSIDYLKEKLSKQALRQYGQYSNLKIGNHPKNSHKKYFKETFQNNQVNVMCISSYKQPTFINKEPIFNENRTYYLTVKGFDTSYVMVGFCTMNNLRLQNSSRSEKSVFYCSTGAFLSDGSYLRLAPRIKENDLLKCTVDYLNNKIVWQINERQSQEMMIPPIAYKEPIHLCLIFGNIGASVNISA